MNFSIPIRLKHLVVAACLSVAYGLNAQSAEAAATASEPSWPPVDPAAVAHWQSFRFGMFIHWGPVSLTGKEIGWSRGKQTPVEIYDHLYQQFNPTNFNADDWVSIAKAAGMKHIVLTTKHHDGFCLWDTKQTDYNIMNTPFHRDVAKELATACRKQGIAFGAYYSTCDCYNTNWPATSPGGTVIREKSDMDAYEKYLQAQITELIQNYGPLITIWNDVPNHKGVDFGKRGANTIKLVRSLQPDILINNRTGDGGDYDTPEQRIGNYQDQRPWESCMTVSAHNAWAWRGDNDGVKSTAACLDMLIRAAGGDGNVLLNVGPRPDGKIDSEQANRLKDIGGWLAKNGESIYGTRGGPFKPGEYGVTTRKDNTIYVHVFRWPAAGALRLPDVEAKLVGAHLLSRGKVDAKQSAVGLEISVAEADRQQVDTVVALEFESDVMKFPAVGLTTVTAETNSTAAAETPVQHDARMEWWRDARFGLFIHWGIYSVPAGEWNGKTNYGEWILSAAKIPVSQYEEFAQQFNPVKFDAKAWVKAAKDAGMKYIVITSKHHDGFGMWPSELTDWCIKSTPFHRDPLQQLSAECKKAGLKFCVYYSIMDWHHPDWGERLDWNDRAIGTPNMDRYTSYVKGQLKELVTRYHPAILWFDGEWKSTWTHERGVDLWKYLRALDPELIINNRIDKGRSGMAGMSANASFVGDYGTPEQQIPPTGFGVGVDWESCMTMNRHWGYNKTDQNWKTAEMLIRNLIDCASKGGNYLLNVGPTSEGVIPQSSLERLTEIGQWMKINGEAIYGTGPNPFDVATGKFSETEKDKKGEPKFIPSWEWRATTKPGKIYLIVFKWPAAGKFQLPALSTKVTSAYLLAGHKKVKFNQSGAGVSISLPKKAPDAIATVICLEINK